MAFLWPRKRAWRKSFQKRRGKKWPLLFSPVSYMRGKGGTICSTINFTRVAAMPRLPRCVVPFKSQQPTDQPIPTHTHTLPPPPPPLFKWSFTKTEAVAARQSHGDKFTICHPRFVLLRWRWGVGTEFDKFKLSVEGNLDFLRTTTHWLFVIQA